MSSSSKIEKALLKYSAKQLKKPRTNKRRNKKPEEESVKEILKWCEQQRWSVHRVESKAVYSRSAGRYLRGQAVAGFPDIVGNTNRGQAVYIEVKAKGKRSTLKRHQSEFLLDKINTGCFALCADSAQHLGSLWIVYSALNEQLGRKYLIDYLPKSFTKGVHF